MAEASIITRAKIDINPNGITLTFEGLDDDLATLMYTAKEFEVISKTVRNLNTTDIVVRSKQAIKFVPRPPQITAKPIVLGTDASLTFVEGKDWSDKVQGITLNGIPLSKGNYTVEDGLITILKSVFNVGAGMYNIVVYSLGYMDAEVTLQVVDTH